MKVMFKHLINGYTGKADDLIIYYNRYLNKVIIRRKPKIKLTQKHIDFKEKSENMSKLSLSEAYIGDFKTYANLYLRLKQNTDKPVSAWYNLFIKMMYAMEKTQPQSINLKTITKEQIYNDNLPCQSVFHCIEAGLLPKVRNYERLNNPM